MLRRLSLVGLCLVLALAVASPARAGDPRPFHGRCIATWDNILGAFTPIGANFVGSGPVTHMGYTVQQGDLFFDGPPDLTGFAHGMGSVTLTAANGDELTFDYVGVLDANTGAGDGTFTFVGGTGRFAGATGEGTFHAVIDLSYPVAQPMTVVLDGQVSY
jgi:hypothetical protein